MSLPSSDREQKKWDRTAKETNFVIVERKDVIETFPKAGDKVAMWCLLTAEARLDDLWTPRCYNKAPQQLVLHDCGNYEPGDDRCEDCPWDKLRVRQ